MFHCTIIRKYFLNDLFPVTWHQILVLGIMGPNIFTRASTTIYTFCISKIGNDLLNSNDYFFANFN